MKTLGKKSLSATLATGINIIWWLECACFAILFFAVISVVLIKKSFAVNIPVTFNNVTLGEIHPVADSLPLGILRANSGNLFLHVGASWLNLMVLLGFASVFLAVLLITYQLRIIFSNFKKDIPFNEVNISRIRYIALILIAYSFGQWLFNIVVNQILIANFKWEHMELTYSFNISCLGIGIMLLIVAEIFKLGAALENENKLTI